MTRPAVLVLLALLAVGWLRTRPRAVSPVSGREKRPRGHPGEHRWVSDTWGTRCERCEGSRFRSLPPAEANRLSRRVHDVFAQDWDDPAMDAYDRPPYRETDWTPSTYHTGTWDPRLER